VDNTDKVFLNADNLNLSPDFLANDGFFANVPISINPRQAYWQSRCLRSSWSRGTPPGSYTGTYELVGTANESNFDPLGAASFTMVVTPEPATLLPIGSALVALGSLR
jgi:hypothetical protein